MAINAPNEGASIAPMLSRRSLLLGSAAAAWAATCVRPARASLSRALSVAELLYQSDHVVVATPGDMTSQWEVVGGTRRMMTYAQVKIESTLDGRPSESSEITVRLLGGTIGGVGQIVLGEAELHRGETAALFVEAVSPGLFSVTAMAQGHYPLVTSDASGVRTLRAHFDHLTKVDPTSAVNVLNGRTLSDVETLIASEMTRRAK
jgi:hypothetical protein